MPQSTETQGLDEQHAHEQRQMGLQSSGSQAGPPQLQTVTVAEDLQTESIAQRWDGTLQQQGQASSLEEV